MVVKTDLHRAASFVDALMAGLNVVPLNEIAAHVGEQVVKDHFYALGAERHRGGPFNFWADAADATLGQANGDSAQIVVDKVGVAQRREGGPITAVNAGGTGLHAGSHLWIPVHPDSEGHTPGDFIDDMYSIIDPLTNKGVAIHEDWDEVYFALVASVTQDADESVDPDGEKLLDSVTTEQLAYIDRLMERTEK